MTPFGQRVRQLRKERNVSQKDMAAALGVSPAYLSELERGNRGQPTFVMVERIIGYFNIIWDDAEELRKLAAVSRPRPRIDTSGLGAAATGFANRLGTAIGELDDRAIDELSETLEANLARLRSD